MSDPAPNSDEWLFVRGWAKGPDGYWTHPDLDYVYRDHAAATLAQRSSLEWAYLQRLVWEAQ